MDQDYPEALDLLARVLRPMANQLRGVAGELRGTHSDDAWREMLRGERTMPLADLARLASSPAREARAAALAALQQLAAPLGYQVTPLEVRPIGVAEAAAAVAESTAPIVATTLRAVADGHIDDLERREILEQVTEAEAKLSALRGAVR
jgi:hypothetical protein